MEEEIQTGNTHLLGHSITRATLPQNPPIRPHGVNSPMSLPLFILKNPRPRKSQRRRQLPAPLLVMQPQPNEMSLRHPVVLERLSPVKDPHVIQEPDVALLHDGADLVAARDGVQRVDGLGLAEG